MTCCPATIQTFLAESITTVAYSGAKPTVTVAYLQDDGTFLFNAIFTLIDIQPTQVVVNHGGIFSGVIKLLQ